MGIIVKSIDGRFFEVDEELLEDKEIKPESLPDEAKQPGKKPQGAGPRKQSPQGMQNSGAPVQVIINMPQGQGNQPQPSVVTNRPGPVKAPSEGEDGDVEGQSWLNCFNNCFYNCFSNCFNNCFRNCFRNCY